MADQSPQPSSPNPTDKTAASGKASWPKTPGGTIDWETVFEHPETGLLAEFARAQTPQALRDTALAIIKQLFTRKGDEEEAARLSGELAELISDDMPEDRLVLVHYAVVATFRQIKVFRQKKAAEYELAKASKQEAERRSATKAQQSIKQTLAKKQKRRARLVAATLAVLILGGGGGGAYYYLRAPVHPPRADQILLQQVRSAAAGATSPTHVFGGALRTRRYLGDISVIAEDVPVDACVTLGVNLAKSGTFTVNGNLLAYGSPDAATALCTSATAPIRISWVPAQ